MNTVKYLNSTFTADISEMIIKFGLPSKLFCLIPYLHNASLNNLYSKISHLGNEFHRPLMVVP